MDSSDGRQATSGQVRTAQYLGILIGYLKCPELFPTPGRGTLALPCAQVLRDRAAQIRARWPEPPNFPPPACRARTRRSCEGRLLGRVSATVSLLPAAAASLCT